MDWLLIFFAVDFILGILLFFFFSKQIRSWNAARQKENISVISGSVSLENTFNFHDTLQLPHPVQRYLKKSIKQGASYISNAHLKQTGKMRFNNRWISLKADQYYTVEPPAFNWIAKMSLGPAWISARDRYLNGKGNMLISVLSSLPLFDVGGSEMNHASLLRYLSELPWLPTAFLSKNITWEELDDRTAKATISDNGISASGIFHFNGSDEAIAFTTPGRFRSDTGKITPWSGTFGDYMEFGSFMLPSAGSAIWNAPEGDFEYIRLKIEAAEFNLSRFDRQSP